MELITDRTEEDVFLRNEKGIYTHIDLNRVESAVKLIMGYIPLLGKMPIDLETKTDWKPHNGFSATDDPTKSQMDRYLKNVAVIRDVFSVPEELPDSMDLLNYKSANKIESVLMEAISKSEAIVKAYFYSGELYAGEGV